jgi:hypothetical protein
VICVLAFNPLPHPLQLLDRPSRRLDDIKNEDELQRFTGEVTDRFGTMPPVVNELLEGIRLRWLGQQMGLEKMVLKKGVLIGTFIADQKHPFFALQGVRKGRHPAHQRAGCEEHSGGEGGAGKRGGGAGGGIADGPVRRTMADGRPGRVHPGYF